MPLESLTDKLKALYSKQNTLPKLIQGEFIPTHTIEEYYVDLQIMLYDKSSLNKETISESQIFEQVKDKQEAHKVLIVGESGTGKSTLLQKMAYMWGKEGIFQNKFDYIIKIKLKLLKGWQEARLDYSVDQRDEPFKCFIHYTLRQERLLNKLANEYIIEMKDIHSIMDQGAQNKILLLLDGYDEIESFISSQNDPEINNIIDKIFDFKNIVMTSRPSVINSDVERYFDRFIENNGFSPVSAQKYIEQFFTKQHNLLIQELDKHRSSEASQNPSLLEYLRSPDNIRFELYAQLTQKIGITEALLADSNIEKIKEIISDYYTLSKSSLVKLLDSNQSLRELAQTPINAVMLCLIYSDKRNIDLETQSETEEVFNLSSLYNKFVVWLGKKYQERIQGSISITSEGISEILVLQHLKKIAYKVFYNSHNELISEKASQIFVASTEILKGNTGEVTGGLLDEVAEHDINAIDNIVSFGLLKISKTTEKKSRDRLIYQDYEFIHNRFKEYLTALYFKDLLLSTDEEQLKKITKFIEKLRYDPSSLNVLKFLAGLVTNELGESAQILVNRFWEAVTCNVDGVLELGLESKVILLMHLLGEAKTKKELLSQETATQGDRENIFEIDTRIPNLEKIRELIDIVVVLDITKFHDQITQSGYSSPKIIEAVLAILNLDYNWKIRYAGGVIKAQGEFISIAVSYLKKVINSADQTESTRDLAKEILSSHNIPFTAKAIEFQKDILTTALNIELQTAMKVVVDLTKTKERALWLMDKAQVFLDYPDWKVKQEGIKIIGQLLKAKLNFLEFNIFSAKQIIDKVQWYICIENLKYEVVELTNIINNAITQDSKKDEFISYKLAIFNNQKQIYERNKKIEEFDAYTFFSSLTMDIVNSEIIDGFIAQLKHNNWLQRFIAIHFFIRLIKEKYTLLDLNIANKLLETLGDTYYEVRSVALDALEIMFAKDHKFVFDLTDGMINKLDEEYFVGSASNMALEQIVKKNIKLINVSKLINKFNNWAWTDSLYEIISTVLEVLKKLETNSAEYKQITDIIIEMLDSGFDKTIKLVINLLENTDVIFDMPANLRIIEKMFNQLKDKYCYFSIDAARAIENISSNLEESDKLQLAQQMIDLLNDKDFDYRSELLEVLGRIAVSASKKISSKILKKLISFSKDQDKYVRATFAEIVGDIVESTSMPIKTKIVRVLVNLSKDQDDYVIKYAVKSLSSIVKNRPKLVNMKLIKGLDSQLQAHSDMHSIVEKAFEYIIENKESFNFRIVKGLLNRLKSQNYDITTITVTNKITVLNRDDFISFNDRVFGFNNIEFAISNKANIDPSIKVIDTNNFNHKGILVSIEILIVMAITRVELITEDMAKELISRFNGDRWLTKALETIAVHKAELINTEKLVELLQVRDDRYRIIIPSTVKIIQAMVINKAEIIELPQIVEILISILGTNDFTGRIGKAAAQALETIAVHKAELINTEKLVELLQVRDDRYEVIVSSAVQIILTVSISSPNLIDVKLLQSIQLLSSNNPNKKIKELLPILLGAIATCHPELISPRLSEDEIAKARLAYITFTLSDFNRKNNKNKEDSIKMVEQLMIDSIYGGDDTELEEVLNIMAQEDLELINLNECIKEIKEVDDISKNIAYIIKVVAARNPQSIDINSLAKSLDFNQEIDDHDYRLRTLKIIELIAKSNLELIRPLMIDNLIEKLSDFDEISEAASNIIRELATYKPELINLNNLFNMLNEKNTYNCRLAIYEILFIIIKFTPYTVVGLLSSLEKNAKEFAIQAFLLSLSNEEEIIKIPLDVIFTIIAFNEKEKKTLVEVAKKALDTKLFTLSGGDIAKITLEYDELLKISYEAPIFFRKLLHKVLNSKYMTEIEKAFITKSIERGAAVSITRDNKIIFEGKIYNLGSTNKAYLEEITRVALAQKDDILVSQYLTYKPLFHHENKTVKVAACDINEVRSIINEAILTHDTWQVSVMHRSDHKLSLPQKQLLLLERRDEFGYHKIHYIKLSTDTIIKAKPFIRYPGEVSKEDREEIFDDMSYYPAKPRYFGKTFLIEYLQGRELLNFLETNPTNNQESIEQINQILQQTLNAEWQSFIQDAKSYTKYELFKLSEETEIKTRSSSFAVDTDDRITTLEINVNYLKTRFVTAEALRYGLNTQIVRISNHVSLLNQQLVTLSEESKEEITSIKSQITAHQSEIDKLDQISKEFPQISRLAKKLHDSLDLLENEFHQYREQLDLDIIEKIKLYINENYQRTIDLEIQISELGKQLQASSISPTDGNESGLVQINKRLRDSQNELIKLKILAAEHQQALELLKPVLDKMKNDQFKIRTIDSDPYKQSFYDNLIQQINAVYAASTVVTTGITGFEQRGFVGSVGKILQIVGSYMPVVGIAVQLFGGVFTFLDQAIQFKLLKNFAELVPNSEKLNGIFDKVAQKILDIEEQLDPEKLELAKLGNMLLDIFNWGIENKAAIRDFLDSSLKTKKEAIYSEGKELVEGYLIENLFEVEEKIILNEKNRGKKFAGILATILIAKIYKGDITIIELKSCSSIKDFFERQAQSVVNMIVDEYGFPLEVYGIAKSIAIEVVEKYKIAHRLDRTYLNSDKKLEIELARMLSSGKYRPFIERIQGNQELKDKIIDSLVGEFVSSVIRIEIFKTYTSSEGEQLFGIKEDLLLSKESFIEKIKIVVEAALAQEHFSVDSLAVQTQSLATADNSKIDNSHLKRAEKQLLLHIGSASFHEPFAEFLSCNQADILEQLFIEAQSSCINDFNIAKTFNDQNKLEEQYSGTITLFSETSHKLHRENILKLITMIEKNEIEQGTVICLERKQFGASLGMMDVILLANILQQNKHFLIPDVITNSPIYYDALLYNAARNKGVLVVGIEGKGLEHSKESTYYHINREEYMANQLITISQLGKESIFLVGSAHIEPLTNLFEGLKLGFLYLQGLNAVLQINLIDIFKEHLSIMMNNNQFVTTQLNQDNTLYSHLGVLKDFIHVCTNAVSEFANIFEFLSNKVISNPFLRSYLLNYVYGNKLVDIQSILEQEYVTSSGINGVHAVLQKHPYEWDKQDFRKIYRVIHPDKGGNAEDFRTLNNFETQIKDTDKIFENLANKLAEEIQPLIRKVNLYAKEVDVVTDIAKLYIKPSTEHAISAVYDSLMLYSKFYTDSKLGYFMPVAASVSVLSNLYQEEYLKAGVSAIHSYSHYLLNPNLILDYGNSVFLGLNGLTVIYDLYHGKYSAAAFQTTAIASMYFAPTITGSLYAIYYTGQNLYSLFQVYQEIQQQNLLGFSKIINNLWEKDSQEVTTKLSDLEISQDEFNLKPSYYWNLAHKGQIETKLSSLESGSSALFINEIIDNLAQNDSFIIPYSIAMSIGPIKAQWTVKTVIADNLYDYLNSFFKASEINLTSALETEFNNLQDNVTIIKFMSISQTHCRIHGYVFNEFEEAVQYEFVESTNSELCGSMLNVE